MHNYEQYERVHGKSVDQKLVQPVKFVKLSIWCNPKMKICLATEYILVCCCGWHRWLFLLILRRWQQSEKRRKRAYIRGSFAFDPQGNKCMISWIMKWTPRETILLSAPHTGFMYVQMKEVFHVAFTHACMYNAFKCMHVICISFLNELLTPSLFFLFPGCGDDKI